MRPGLSVFLSAEPHGELDRVRGTVTRVRGKEVVVQLAGEPAPSSLRLTPRRPLRLAYRHGQDGPLYHVPAEVKAMDGPGRVAVELLGPAVEAEDRDQPRSEHLLRMDYDVVPPADIERVRSEILRGAQIVKYEWRSPALRMAAGAEDDLPPAPATMPFVQHLGRIERKLDVLLERLGIEPRGVVSEKPLYNVSLSIKGIRCRDYQNRCSPGDMVRVRIELPLEPTVEVIALGEVTCAVKTGGTQSLSAGRDLVIEFSAMKDESRQAIERYVQRAQPARRSA